MEGLSITLNLNSNILNNLNDIMGYNYIWVGWMDGCD